MGDKTGGARPPRRHLYRLEHRRFGFAPSTDPIYKSIPFYIGVASDGVAYGLFLDNSWRSSFDFGHRDPDAIEISAPDGPIDYYLIAGPTVADVVRRYTDLTGKAPLPPLWALGYQQSRWSYIQRCRGPRDRRAPARRPHPRRRDLDGHRLSGALPAVHGQPAPSPTSRSSMRDMSAEGSGWSPITDLHVAYLPNQGYVPFDSGLAGNNFVRKADGSLYVAPVWPGPVGLPGLHPRRDARLVGQPV